MNGNEDTSRKSNGDERGHKVRLVLRRSPFFLESWTKK